MTDEIKMKHENKRAMALRSCFAVGAFCHFTEETKGGF